MEINNEKYCVLCEANGEEKIKAEFFVKFNNDLIPVCNNCNDLIKQDNLLDILNEQSTE